MYFKALVFMLLIVTSRYSNSMELEQPPADSLYHAIMSQSADTVRDLLARGAHPNIPIKDDNTALDVCAVLATNHTMPDAQLQQIMCVLIQYGAFCSLPHQEYLSTVKQ